IGGTSPLLAITRELATKVEARVGVPTKIAMRLWHPFPDDVVRELVDGDVNRIAVVALAQFSAKIYRDAIVTAAKRIPGGSDIEIRATTNWGSSVGLVAAQAKRVQNAIHALPPETRKNSQIIFSAHSLPKIVVDRGDPYERDFRASVAAIAKTLGLAASQHLVCFQSQGMAGPSETQVAWLGPALMTALHQARMRAAAHVVFAPIGFLADHVEILYDLDIEAAEFAKEMGMTSSRCESLNASDDFADVVASLARPLLA
ncbi:MAG: ferrochelatase, partial [Polyangiaceae bacterium]